MRFLIGIAGIPRDIYDAVIKERKKIGGENVELFWEPFQADVGGSFPTSHRNFFLRSFQDRAEGDRDNRLAETGFGLVCVRHDAQSTSAFVEKFFPAVLCDRVEWQPQYGQREVIERSKNELVAALRDSVLRLRSVLPFVYNEVTSRANRTPVLLPLKNFESRVLKPALELLHANLAKADAGALIRKTVAKFQAEHPFESSAQGSPKFHRDRRNIEFRAPNGKHAHIRTGQGHPPLCVLAGGWRLGAPFPKQFHYDCVSRAGGCAGWFQNCHDTTWEELHSPTHINIAPNDFIRGGA